MTLREQPHHLESHQKKYFVCATIRILGAWLSEETMAMREEVYEILPFILDISNDTFESQKLTKLSLLPGRGSTDFSDFTAPDSCAMMQRQPGKQVIMLFWIKKPMVDVNELPPQYSDQVTPDTLRFLLPALCHLIAGCPNISKYPKYLNISRISQICYAASSQRRSRGRFFST